MLLSERRIQDPVLAIGASTGGTEAIFRILSGFPKTTSGILIVQHLPGGFTRSFAERLNALCTIEVREARDGDNIRPGLALIAPGDAHMRMENRDGRAVVSLEEGVEVNYHRPSVDVLFHSVAKTAGSNAVGVILTGMGIDGAEGLSAMREAGAVTMAQNEETCSVFGMPRVAIERGSVEFVAPLEKLGSLILLQLRKKTGEVRIQVGGGKGKK